MPLTAVLYSALGVLVMDANMHSLLSSLSVLACSVRYLSDTHDALLTAKTAWDFKNGRLKDRSKRLLELNAELLEIGVRRAKRGDYDL